jgi:hypothetical protein
VCRSPVEDPGGGAASRAENEQDGERRREHRRRRYGAPVLGGLARSPSVAHAIQKTGTL